MLISVPIVCSQVYELQDTAPALVEISGVIHPTDNLMLNGTIEASLSFFVGFLAAGLVPMAPDSPCDSFGAIFKPDGRFATHFGPNLTLRRRTETLVGLGQGLTSPAAAMQPAAGAFFQRKWPSRI